MADDNENEEVETGNESGEQQKQSAGKVMRQKLEDTLADNAKLTAKLMVHEAGLSHLTEKQRNAAVRDATEDGAELTAESLKKSAKELGFPESPRQTVNGNEGEGGSNNGDNADGGNDEEIEPANSMEAIEQAARRTVTVPADGSFEQKMKAAKSTEEVEALIRTEGHKVGIVHEWDTE